MSSFGKFVVVDSVKTNNGDTFELRVYGSGTKSAWGVILKTMQNGKSTKNESGGYPPISTGKVDYVTRLFKKYKV
jgi:hypothetical protein